jgi:uncharacterized protein (DUF1800 family)
MYAQGYEVKVPVSVTMIGTRKSLIGNCEWLAVGLALADSKRSYLKRQSKIPIFSAANDMRSQVVTKKRKLLSSGSSALTFIESNLVFRSPAYLTLAGVPMLVPRRLPVFPTRPPLQSLARTLGGMLVFVIFLSPGFASTALSQEQQAIHVLNRLAYGPRPGDIERVSHMGVRRYIESQLDPSTIPLPSSLVQRLNNLPIQTESPGTTLAEFLSVRGKLQEEGDVGKQRRRETIARIVDQTAEARLLRAIESPRQLEEVMVDFWFNHFNVFSGKGLDRALISSYERDAIRPYALGSFRDLLGATAKHPAMLFYLDNWLSTAADFRPDGAKKNLALGQKAQSSGLNENYARELMELHTLGVDGGYSQKDVSELARMLTGWTFNPRTLAKNNQGFLFDERRHDVGDKEWMGHHIGMQGQGEGEFALDVLAMHPATAHHLSYLLAQYFVQDIPPPGLVDRMSRRYLDTRGDIRSVLRTLFFSPEFMDASAVSSKFKTPYRYVISAARATDLTNLNIRPLLGTLNQLGMPLFGCQTPDGYKNTEAAWLNPDALTRRIAFASALASGKLRVTPTLPASSIPMSVDSLLHTLGSAVSPRTRNTLSNNPPALQASMLLGSPDFMQH